MARPPNLLRRLYATNAARASACPVTGTGLLTAGSALTLLRQSLARSWCARSAATRRQTFLQVPLWTGVPVPPLEVEIGF